MSQTVLVADDSQTIRKVVQMALKASKYEVAGVGSAREAVEAAKQQPTVILLDYYMPDGSGYEVCQAIKQNEATSAIPVVMLGGTYKDFDPDLARQSGASGFVMKPFKTAELVDAIESAVNGAGQQQAQQPQQRQQPQQPQPKRQRQSTQPQQQVKQQQRQKAPSAPAAQPPSQTPVPESQPRIPVNSQTQSRAPSPDSQGSQPRIPGSGSQPGVSKSDSNSGARQRKPTPAPGGGGGGGQAATPAVSQDEIEKMIRNRVQAAVREELPGLLRNVMGEIFQQKVLPKLLKHTDDKIGKALDDKLDDKITRQVRMELERLLEE